MHLGGCAAPGIVDSAITRAGPVHAGDRRLRRSGRVGGTDRRSAQRGSVRRRLRDQRRAARPGRRRPAVRVLAGDPGSVAVSLLPITLAAGPYDRTRALADGRVTIAGADLRYITLDPEEIFFRMVTHGEFDVSEMSMATYHVLRKAEQAGAPAPFAAIPVFPSRMFRHTSVYVNTAHPAGGASAASALAGRHRRGGRVAAHRQRLDPRHPGRALRRAGRVGPYRTGGLDAPGRHEKFALTLPDSIDIAPVPAGQTLFGPARLGRDRRDLLAAGAAVVRHGGACGGCSPTRRPKRSATSRETGIFPIMHVLVIRRDVYEANRWLPRELFKAFTAAKRIAYDELTRTAALAVSLPFAREEYESTVDRDGRRTTGPTASSRTGPFWRRSPATPPPSTLSRTPRPLRTCSPRNSARTSSSDRRPRPPVTRRTRQAGRRCVSARRGARSPEVLPHDAGRLVRVPAADCRDELLMLLGSERRPSPGPLPWPPGGT